MLRKDKQNLGFSATQSISDTRAFWFLDTILQNRVFEQKEKNYLVPSTTKTGGFFLVHTLNKDIAEQLQYTSAETIKLEFHRVPAWAFSFSFSNH